MGLSCQYSNKIISKVKNYTKIAICKWTNTHLSLRLLLIRKVVPFPFYYLNQCRHTQKYEFQSRISAFHRQQKSEFLNIDIYGRKNIYFNQISCLQICLLSQHPLLLNSVHAHHDHYTWIYVSGNIELQHLHALYRVELHYVVSVFISNILYNSARLYNPKRTQNR